MGKEIIAVFQDCVLCGDKGRKKIAEFAEKGINVRKVGFTTPEGKDLIHKAVFEHKIGSMPFFTDGEKFSVKIEDLVEKPVVLEKLVETELDKEVSEVLKPLEKPAKTTKKSTKKVKEHKNGAI